jgi:DNA-binding transcriptional regulator YiaG
MVFVQKNTHYFAFFGIFHTFVLTLVGARSTLNVETNKMKELIERLIEIMAKQGVGCEKVAREIGVSHRTVERWVKGKSKPSDLACVQIRRFIRENE